MGKKRRFENVVNLAVRLIRFPERKHRTVTVTLVTIPERFESMSLLI